MRNPFSITFRFSKDQFDRFKEFIRGLQSIDQENWNDESVKLNIPGMPGYKLILCEYMLEGYLKTQILAVFDRDFLSPGEKRCNIIMLEKYVDIGSILIQKWNQKDKDIFLNYIQSIERELKYSTNKIL